MSTVKKEWEMQCPKCKKDSYLDVQVQSWVRLVPDGTDADEASEHDTEWDEDSRCDCRNCGNSGKVHQFKVKS